MASRLCLFLAISLFGSMGSIEFPTELIVWNVGQGQWVTLIDENACWHIDMGGEFAPWREIMARCRLRSNRISLSHWDMDHIVFVGPARQRSPNLCLINSPLGPTSPRKRALLDLIPSCAMPSPYSQWSNPNGKTANAKSWVVTWHGVLAQGDSPRDQEKIWLHLLVGLENVRFLILGHHGSRTSTSPALLAALPKVQIALSSARVRRYGHPHPEVVRALSERHIPLLRTEEWGTIHIFL